MGMKARKRRKVLVSEGYVASREPLYETLRWVRIFGDELDAGMSATEDEFRSGFFGTPIRRRVTVIIEDV